MKVSTTKSNSKIKSKQQQEHPLGRALASQMTSRLNRRHHQLDQESLRHLAACQMLANHSLGTRDPILQCASRGQLEAKPVSPLNEPEPIDPEAAARAMVGAARATLVILMGVLVLKLTLSSNKSTTSTRSNKQRRSSSSNQNSFHLHDNNQTKKMSDSHDNNNKNNIQFQDQQHQSNRINSNSSQLVFSSMTTAGEPDQLKRLPGPRGLPILGYLPFLGKDNLHVSLDQLSRKHGPIYEIFLGKIRLVVLSDAQLVRQAFREPVFSGRPDTQLTRILQGYGIINSDGALWKEQRAFLHSALRKLGVKSLMNGSNGLEAKIQNQVSEFLADLGGQAETGKSFDMRPFVARSVSSVVGSIVMNSTHRKEEDKFDRLIELMDEGFRLYAIALPLDFLPILRFVPGISWAYNKIKQNRQETSAFFNEFADQHRRYLGERYQFNFDTNKDGRATQGELHPNQTRPSQLLDTSNLTGSLNREQQEEASKSATTTATTTTNLGDIKARDLIDAYIIRQKQHEADGKHNYFSDRQLVQIMSDIFSAGLETVTSSIEWSILFMILNPKCQQKVQDEIDQVIGQDRLAQLDDLLKMPYTEATIFEVLRRSNVVTLGTPHATLEDASIGGYFIPKGSQVLPNFYSMNMSSELWHEPEKFEPERFLVKNKVQKPDHFIPFSVGRRVCLGDMLAKMEIFLFLVGLLQKFQVSVAPEDQERPPLVQGTIGLSNSPVAFKVALTRRP